jgi:hypothetical protein
MILKANFLFAFNSVEIKKVERFEETIKSYHNFVDYFSESTNLKTAEAYFNTSVKEIEKLKTLN